MQMKADEVIGLKLVSDWDSKDGLCVFAVHSWNGLKRSETVYKRMIATQDGLKLI